MKTPTSTINQCLKYAVILISTALLGSFAYAEPNTESPKTADTKTPANLENSILSIVTGRWNNDKRTDSAVLLKSGDQADLYLYLGNATGDMELALAKKNLVWSGALAGTLPQLKAIKGGGLFIYSLNDAVGRTRWHQRLTVDYRDNDFVVTGYIYDERDTLDTNVSSVCDVNLLTGQGLKNKTPFKIEGQKIKLSDWSDEKIPKECKN